jgi:predicted metal-dependent peptidase
MPVFNDLKDKKIDMLVYLTDLYIDFPDKPPKYKVLWGIMDNPEGKPPFGQAFHIRGEKHGRNRY